MTGIGAGPGRAKRLDLACTVRFGALYAAGAALVVTGFAVEPSGCGGRFRASCTGAAYWRLGIGFGLVVVVAPLLHKLLPSVPFEQGVGRAAGVAALLSGAAAGVGLVLAAPLLVG
ncbi:hypothetical protein [Kitasatospora sp. NPDC004289]